MLRYNTQNKIFFDNWDKVQKIISLRHPTPCTEVLIFWVDFWELSHLTRDLSQTEKKITVVTSWATDKMTTIFSQNDNFNHFEWNRFCAFARLVITYISFSAWDKSSGEWENFRNSSQNMRTLDALIKCNTIKMSINGVDKIHKINYLFRNL